MQRIAIAGKRVFDSFANGLGPMDFQQTAGRRWLASLAYMKNIKRNKPWKIVRHMLKQKNMQLNKKIGLWIESDPISPWEYRKVLKVEIH